MIGYLLEFGITHSLLVLGYWLFLRKESQYGKLRVYLIASTLLALVVPLLNIPALIASLQPSNDAGPQLFTMVLNPVTFTAIEPGESRISFWLIGYGLVSLWFLSKFIISLSRLVIMNNQSQLEVFENIYVRKVKSLPGSFTFFNWIFVSKDIENEREEYLPIIKHEQAHARLGHSYDLLLIEIVKIVAWWLPSTWYARKEIKKIHEYQADAYALKSFSMDRYSSILISSTLKSHGLSLASSFHDGLILKRLKAMKQNVTQIKSWKLSLLGIFMALLVLTFACNEELDEDLQKMSEHAYQTGEIPEFMQGHLAELQKEYPGEKFKYAELLMDSEGDVTSEQMRNKLKEMDVDQRLIQAVDVNKKEGIIGLLLKEGAAMDYASEKTKQEGDVFTIVDTPPSYKGGMDTFYRYVGENIEYPTDARKQGIEGRVYVQFIVEKDGSLSDVKVVKGIGGGCDEEAAKIVANAPGFIPGSQRGEPVRVRMVMPVIFKFFDSEPAAEGTKPQGESLQDIVVVGKQK